jgi:hypothetical protein
MEVASAVIEAALAIEVDEVEVVAVEVHREEVEALREEEAAQDPVSKEEPKWSL